MHSGREGRTVFVAMKELRATPLLDKAAHVALARSGRLVLFHDLADPVFVDALGSRAETRRHLSARRSEAMMRLESLGAPWRARGLEISCSAEWDFPPHAAIVRAATHVRADLIVVQARGRHRLPALLGYTDWSLLRDSPIPVLLVKRRRPYRRPRILAAVDPAHAHSKPLALDDAILGEASRLAESFGGSAHVVHSYLSSRPTVMRGVAPGARARADKVARDAARAALAGCLEGWEVPETRQHLVPGEPAEAILRTQRSVGAAVVAMGAVSRRGLKGMFIGNTAERLLDELPCDLLVVKPADFAARVARARRGANLVSVGAFAG